MKAGNFRYARPASLQAALEMLARQPDATPLAGGQSLLAMMNLRVAAPALLVDIGGLEELRTIELRDGLLCIGAGTCHRAVLESPLVATHFPLLAEALTHVAHPAVRNRGTLGGSLALADPTAEMPACVTVLGGRLVLASAGGRREVPAEAFFTGLMETALSPGELIVQVRLPVPSAGTVWGFGELTRRHGDFAMVGLAATARAQAGGLTDFRLVYFGCADYPRLAKRVAVLFAAGGSAPLEKTALAQALLADLGTFDSPGCRGDTRLTLAAAVTRRVFRDLWKGDA